MIQTVRLWETLMQGAKTGTSGYQTADEFNRDLASVQTSLMGLLAPLYSDGQVVQDLLAPFVVSKSGPSLIDGSITKPTDYFQMADASVAGYPAYPISVNERAMLKHLPSRRPNSARNVYAYFLEADKINFLPKEVLSTSITYIRQAVEAKIVLTPASNQDSDYLVPTSTLNLEWPERAFNLILYMMMQKLGLSTKESLLLEFANMGINVEQSKI